MVWNIHFQLAGLLITLLVAGMCLGQKHLNFASEKAFSRVLFFVLICAVLDILSVVSINYRGVFGTEFAIIACSIYLMGVMLVGCQSAWFAVAEIRATFRKFWVRITAAPLAVVLVSLFVFPIKYNVTGNVIFLSGIPVILTYSFIAIYIVTTAGMVVMLRDQINGKTRNSIYFWLVVLSVGGLIQLLTHIQLSTFAMAIGCIYMYCTLENPEYHLDFATSVFNAKGFSMIMAENIKHGVDQALITFSLGDMGIVNDIFGAKAVEKLIIEISSFADGIPESKLFRMEDNLFCLSLDHKEKAENALEMIIKRFESPWIVNGVMIEIKVSLSYIDSISAFTDSEDVEEIVHYFAKESLKRNSGDILYINEEELNNRQRNIELQHSLEWAFKNDGVEVYYQPIYSVREGRFNSLEALVRVRDENGSIIMPSDFIEYAERNGMVLRIGELVFRKVCEFIQRMHIETYGIDYVEVNLSVVQCMQENFSRLLKNIMGEYQIAPYRINFEITETAVETSHGIMDKNMKDLLAYGSGFSLDDYGSGYSNLSHVVNLPLRIIKIDKLLVDEYFTSEKVRVATGHTIEMIHDLGMEVVIEGVETEEQYLEFKRLGVEYIQGFYFSKPLPKDKVLNYIQEWL